MARTRKELKQELKNITDTANIDLTNQILEIEAFTNLSLLNS